MLDFGSVQMSGFTTVSHNPLIGSEGTSILLIFIDFCTDTAGPEAPFSPLTIINNAGVILNSRELIIGAL